MIFRQLYLTCLSHASYLIGSEGIGAVVDPRRDVDEVIALAESEGLRIRYVIETHLHADFVSGHAELARRTGAEVVMGARAGALFPHRAIQDGDEIAMGSCRLRFLETPGHTPEGVSILVTDLAKGPDPFAVLTGDTLFIGDVGRPDLSREHSPEELAGMLYDSLHGKLLALPDGVEVYPAHGAGSLCGRNISAERCSTIGRERAHNHALRPMPKEDFVRMMTAGLPERPSYFARDAEINRRGAAPLASLPPLKPLEPADVEQETQSGALVLDTRPVEAFGAGHIPGSIHVGLGGTFATWVGTLIGIDRGLVIVAENRPRANEARTRLSRVGVDRVRGFLEGGVDAWSRSGRPLSRIPALTVRELHQRIQAGEPIQILDVRRPLEWEAGEVQGATHVPLDRLARSLDSLVPNRPIAVHCKSGYRSSIATSLLEGAGFREVWNVTGGFDAWLAESLPVSVPAATAATASTATTATTATSAG